MRRRHHNGERQRQQTGRVNVKESRREWERGGRGREREKLDKLQILVLQQFIKSKCLGAQRIYPRENLRCAARCIQLRLSPFVLCAQRAYIATKKCILFDELKRPKIPAQQRCKSDWGPMVAAARTRRRRRRRKMYEKQQSPIIIIIVGCEVAVCTNTFQSHIIRAGRCHRLPNTRSNIYLQKKKKLNWSAGFE